MGLRGLLAIAGGCVPALMLACEALVGIEHIDLLAPDALAPPDNDAGVDAAPDVRSVADAGANPCADVPAKDNGVFCGSSAQSGFAGGAHDTLYTCGDGGLMGTAICPRGCYVAGAGVDDQCVVNPCATTTHFGKYCGTSNQLGFDTGHASPTYVYDCGDGGVFVTATLCTMGCFVADAGTNDGCR